jgi:hypothetical protein
MFFLKKSVSLGIASKRHDYMFPTLWSACGEELAHAGISGPDFSTLQKGGGLLSFPEVLYAQ